MANARGRNFLDKTTVNGVMLSKEAAIKDNADLGILELPFSKEEVFLALSSLGGTKLWVCTTFPYLFRNFVGFQEGGVDGVFKEFYDHGTFKRSLNATFIA
ncbi:hypothetical protein CK203_086155 [Vitis vinifera]|uniref:Uncharacterized protein n=1 Tax=Vitis vinifera TaxID=29760 RepID=A0A438CTB4_VITVI|nr:hypothetical protein CK203_086155 [Vitis vinifera]